MIVLGSLLRTTRVFLSSSSVSRSVMSHLPAKKQLDILDKQITLAQVQLQIEQTSLKKEQSVNRRHFHTKAKLATTDTGSSSGGGLFIPYPATPRSTTTYTHHGVTVADPYSALEDPHSDATSEWVDAQNSVTQAFLHACPNRRQIKERVTSLYNYPRYSCPFKRGTHFFFFKNNGLQNQSVLFLTDSLKDGAETVLLDPNTLSEDGTAALGAYEFSEDGRYLAYGISRSGSDWQTIHIIDVESKDTLQDKVEHVKFSGISWTHDHRGFFYSRYPAAKTDNDNATTNGTSSATTAKKADQGSETSELSHHTLYYHVLGTPQSSDVIVYQSAEFDRWMFTGEVSDDGQYVIITISESTDPVNRLYYIPLNGIIYNTNKTNINNNVIKLIDHFNAEYSYITNDENIFYFKTNHNASRYKVISIDINQSNNNIQEIDIIPHSDTDVLSFVRCVNKKYLITCYMHDVTEKLFLHYLNNGNLVQNVNITIPGLGAISGLTGRKQDTEFFYSFTSFTVPGTIYHATIRSAESSTAVSTAPAVAATSDSTSPPVVTSNVFRETVIAGLDLSQFDTSQVKYASKDGTMIPMFIISRKGSGAATTKKKKETPCLLYGYGGFSISLSPSFSIGRIVFVDAFDGIYCVPNLRGGGEYGEDWHQGGTKQRKQNVFDDFQTAAEYLISEGYTSAPKIAINGGSNGGLLVGACVNQRPELFGAAVAAVGVLDMLRFHLFTIGKAWQSDYGYVDKEEDFKALYAYSPLHNINKDKAYPAVLLTTADHDDRVVPLHSYKYIAQLQHTVGARKDQTAPLLIRIETKAGHGAGMPLSKRIQEQADVFAFLAKVLNVTLKI